MLLLLFHYRISNVEKFLSDIMLSVFPASYIDTHACEQPYFQGFIHALLQLTIYFFFI